MRHLGPMGRLGVGIPAAMLGIFLAVTPALACGLLEGVTRGVLLRLARRTGIRAHEGRYTLRDLLRAEESFLSSTTLEVMPVVKVKVAGDRRVYRIGSGRPGPVARRLHAIFRIDCRDKR